jgi:hypothetical protein
VRTRKFVGHVDINALAILDVAPTVNLRELVEDVVNQSRAAERLLGPRGGKYVVEGPIQIVGTQQTITGMSIAWRAQGRYVRPGRS